MPNVNHRTPFARTHTRRGAALSAASRVARTVLRRRARYGVPIAESAGFAPTSPYACSKLAVEYMLEDCRTAHGLSYATLRYFNVAGADPEARIGESHSPETHALPLVIDAALRRRAQFSIFGTDYPTPDGTAVRDYVHVNDLAAAQSWRWNTSYRRMMRLSSISVPARAVRCVT